MQLVEKGTPAAKAGFEVEDVIVKFNGKEVAGEPELRDMISRTAPGTAVPVVIKRGDETKTLTVTLGVPTEPKEVAERGSPARKTR